MDLLVLLGLAIAFPHLMISPGPLARGHTNLTNDCFACHAPWRGAASQRCMKCHALTDIGLRTTKGTPLPRGGIRPAFHQQLTDQTCVACHSDHAGPKLTQRTRKLFSHNLLRPDMRQRCETCHAAPKDEMHRALTVSCVHCHTPEAWKPANFQHSALASDVLARCEACHKAPNDEVHLQVHGNCGACHGQKGWKPTTFDHARFFMLDGDHNAKCVTCHLGSDYSRYTCYGCHEHTPEDIRAQHAEEGITQLNNCVKCHRSSSGEAEGDRSREGRERD